MAEVSTRQMAIDEINAQMPSGIRVSFERYTADYRHISKRPIKVHQNGRMLAAFASFDAVRAKYLCNSIPTTPERTL